MMERTGGGFLQSHGMNSDLPPAMPAKPLPQQPPQQAAPPQGPPPGMPPQGAPQGMPQGGGYLAEPAQDAGVNNVASNALMILHDEESGPAFDQLIQQGPQGAGQALAELYSQVRQGYEAQGQPMDEDEAGEAVEAVLADIWEIGKAQGSLTSGEDLKAAMAHGFDLIAQQFPDVAADMQAMAQESVEPEPAVSGMLG